MNRCIKLIIFDLDGTLMDAYGAVSRSINFTMKKFGLPKLSAAMIKRTVGWGDKHLLEAFVGKAHSQKALAIYRRHHERSLRQDTKFLPGAKRVLRELRKEGYLLAVASNRPTKFSLIALRHLKIQKVFDFILCGDKARRPKPYPDILLQILARFKLRSDDALYVGDMTIDVQTGRRAKIRTIAVTTGSSTAAELAALKPYRLIRRVDAVIPILDHMNGRAA